MYSWEKRCIFFLILCLAGKTVTAQSVLDKVIEIDGVVVTSDSTSVVPNATVLVKNQDRGVESALSGVFSIVCYKGDTLEFSCLGFRTREYIVPSNLNIQHYSIILPLVQDTFYLPEMIIRPLPSREEFAYAFLHWRIPYDYYEKSRRNTNKYVMRTLAYTLPRDGREAQGRSQSKMAEDALYYGSQKPMNIFNPLAWGQFFEAWKKGDFRKQNNPYEGDY